MGRTEDDAANALCLLHSIRVAGIYRTACALPAKGGVVDAKDGREGRQLREWEVRARGCVKRGGREGGGGAREASESVSRKSLTQTGRQVDSGQTGARQRCA